MIRAAYSLPRSSQVSRKCTAAASVLSIWGSGEKTISYLCTIQNRGEQEPEKGAACVTSGGVMSDAIQTAARHLSAALEATVVMHCEAVKHSIFLLK